MLAGGTGVGPPASGRLRAPEAEKTPSMTQPNSAEHKGWYSRNYLPHFDSADTVQHIVFRTIGSLPRDIAGTLPEDTRAARKAIEELLDCGAHGGDLLDSFSRQTVEAALLHGDGKRYRLLAWCVMPNHVHVLIEQMQGDPLGEIVRAWKSFTSLQINRARGKTGQFWARDFFDRYMRNEDQVWRAIGYIEGNPVKAGLVQAAADWPFSSARLERSL
jgi:putative transposase